MPKTGALMKRWKPHATYRFKIRGQIEVVVCGLRAERQPPLILARHDAVKRVERRVAHEVTEGSSLNIVHVVQRGNFDYVCPPTLQNR